MLEHARIAAHREVEAYHKRKEASASAATSSTAVVRQPERVRDHGGNDSKCIVFGEDELDTRSRSSASAPPAAPYITSASVNSSDPGFSASERMDDAVSKPNLAKSTAPCSRSSEVAEDDEGIARSPPLLNAQRRPSLSSDLGFSTCVTDSSVCSQDAPVPPCTPSPCMTSRKHAVAAASLPASSSSSVSHSVAFNLDYFPSSGSCTALAPAPHLHSTLI